MHILSVTSLTISSHSTRTSSTSRASHKRAMCKTKIKINDWLIDWLIDYYYIRMQTDGWQCRGIRFSPTFVCLSVSYSARYLKITMELGYCEYDTACSSVSLSHAGIMSSNSARHFLRLSDIWPSRLFSTRKRGSMFLPALVYVSLCVCLWPRQLKDCGRICTKFYGKVQTKTKFVFRCDR